METQTNESRCLNILKHFNRNRNIHFINRNYTLYKYNQTDT